MNILVCVSFHYVESRFSNFKKVVDIIKNYPHNTKIIVDTNQYFDMGDVDIVIHDNLWHPYQLAWEHRKHVLSNLDDYDYFMYVEDDMYVPYESFSEFVENFDDLWPKYIPGFIRVETYNGEDYVVDIYTHKSKSSIIEINNKKYIGLNYPEHYHAFWILPQKQLKEIISEKFYMLSKCREHAASCVLWGDFSPRPIALIRVEDGTVSTKSFSYHLSNNYSSNPDNQFGKIKLSKIIV
jgi:hypothetical protein